MGTKKGARMIPKPSSTGYRYLNLADEIENKIKSGVYKAGNRIPSIRNVRERSGISINTVSQAYIELEKRGLVEARQKSGFYVKPLLDHILPSPRINKHQPEPKRVSINTLASSVVEAMGDRSMLKLGGTLVAPELLPLKSIASLIKSLPTKKIVEILSTYENPAGSEHLRRQIISRTLTLFQQTDMEDIVITNGCVEAVSYCLQAVASKGDTIIVESPTYPWFLQMIEDLNLLALELPTHPRTGIDLDSVETAINRHDVKACILVANFHNPMGFEMPEENKKRLVRLMNQKQVAIIEDDIHGDLYFGTRRPSTLKSYDTDGHVLYCSSFSKTVAPGMRIGWTLPGVFKSAVKQHKLNHAVASPPLIQYALAEFLKGGAYDRHLRKLRTALKNQVSNMATAVARFFPEDTRITAPKGGFALWVELNPQIDSLAVYREAQRHQIAILPGIMCSTTPKFNHFIRLSCGFPWSDALEQGIRRLGDIVHTFKAEQTIRP
jgi:DNA-binding transcriptional MocR family regulator